jgi:hypothetical protein
MKLNEITPENWSDIEKLNPTDTNADALDKINHLVDVVNQLVKNTIGI